jgi:thiol-disulfide isomerase/thioredoxin
MRSRLVTAVLAAILVPACAGAAGPAAPEGTPATNAARAALLPTSVDTLPDVDLAGFRALLGQVAGTPLVVNVWASWCGPCQEEAPRLAAAARANPGVQFLGIDILDTRSDARAFIAEHGWTFPSLFDATAEVRDGLGLLGQPVTLFYAADGTLASSYMGPIPAEVLAERIAGIAP